MSDPLKARTGLFVGAGFSYEAGMPLVWELTAEIKNWITGAKLLELNESWKAQGGGLSESVLNDFLSVLSRPDMHYEAILGYLTAQTRHQRQQEVSGEYHYLNSWLIQMVYHLLYLRQVNNFGFLQANLPFYDGIKALVEESDPLWVFTLNHDVIIEAIAARLEIKLHSGFSPEIIGLPTSNRMGAKIGEIRAEILTKDTLDNHAMYFPNPPQPGLYLLKIHGALDIFTFNDGDDLLKLLPDGEGWAGTLNVLREANEHLFYPVPGAPRGRANTMNVITYADDQGIMQFLRQSLLAGAYKFDKRFSQTLPMSMMKHFQDNINFVTHLVCIGYSFGDVHVNQVIREWLELTDSRSLEIVSPDAKDVPSYLLHVAPQVKITRLTATAYLDARAGIARSLRQRVEKCLRDILRLMPRDSDASEQASPDSLRQMQVFIEIVQRLEQLPATVVYGEDGPIALAEKWAKEPGLTQGQLLDRLRANVAKQYPG